MTGKKKVRIAALGLIAVSLGNLLVLSFVAPASADWGTRALRFTLTCILVAFLFRGASWARWVIGALCAMGVLAGIVSLIALPAMGAGWGLLSEWMLVMTAALGWIAWTLLADGDVSRYFSGEDG